MKRLVVIQGLQFALSIFKLVYPWLKDLAQNSPNELDDKVLKVTHQIAELTSEVLEVLPRK